MISLLSFLGAPRVDGWRAIRDLEQRNAMQQRIIENSHAHSARKTAEIRNLMSRNMKLHAAIRHFHASWRRLFNEALTLRREVDERAIRAVVAAQWAVACTVMDEVDREDSSGRNGHFGANNVAEAIEELPTAEQIVWGGA